MAGKNESKLTAQTQNDQAVAGSAGMLLRLGRIAGIGGIAVGVLLLLFQEFIRQKFFPTLAPDHAYRLLVLFLLFTFGTAVVGLAIWASQAIVNRVVILGLLVFATVLGVAGLVVVKPASVPAVYQVRVTVLTPQRVPTDAARVWSSIGGEPLRVAGGWMFEIPAARKPPDGRMKIFAEQPAAFWKGEAAVELGENYTPSAEILLKRDAGAQVRGIVTDRHGRAVAGARVSIVGYGEESVVTASDGSFSLGAHAADGQQVQLHAEKEGYAPVSQSHPAGDSPATLVLQ